MEITIEIFAIKLSPKYFEKNVKKNNKTWKDLILISIVYSSMKINSVNSYVSSKVNS